MLCGGEDTIRTNMQEFGKHKIIMTSNDDMVMVVKRLESILHPLGIYFRLYSDGQVVARSDKPTTEFPTIGDLVEETNLW